MGTLYKKRYFRKSKHSRETGRVDEKKRTDPNPIIGVVVMIFLAAGTTGFCLTGYKYLTHWDYFRVRTVHVSGMNHLTKGDILNRAGFRIGDNILKVNLFRAEKKLETHPWIVEAEIKRSLPDILNIRIKEQIPLAVIELGKRYLINRSGLVFKEFSSTDPNDLPLVTGLTLVDIDESGNPNGPVFSSVMDVLKIGRRYDSFIPNGLVQRIHADPEIGLTLYAPRAIPMNVNRIKLGVGDFLEKYDRLKHLTRFLKERNYAIRIETIDLNDNDRIVVDPVLVEKQDETG